MRSKNRLNGMKNFVVYYGHGQEGKLTDYDLLILEPKGHGQRELLALKQAGKLLIAYLSIVEVSRQDKFYKTLDRDDFLKADGKVLINREYDTMFMDISGEKVQNLLIDRAATLLKNGYDGLFFDTVGDLEYVQVSEDKRESLLAAAGLIAEEIRKAFPTAVLIQNNGLTRVCDYTDPFIDAICFENPPYNTLGNLKWSFSAFHKLDRLGRDYNIRTLLLQEVHYKDRRLQTIVLQTLFKIIARLKGYLYYETEKFYTEI